MNAVRITIPGVPPSLNQYFGRENTNEYRKAKVDWTDRVVWLVKKMRPEKPFNKARVEILYYFPDNRRRDPDNYCGKLMLDGLTKAGVIVDDSFQHITLAVGGAVDQRQPRTVITVTEETG